MKYFILLPFFVSPIKAGEPSTLNFDQEITWKQIFDAGLRPKHLFPKDTCVVQESGLSLKFKSVENKFKLSNGRLSIAMAFQVGEISLIWHQGSEAITLAEGKRRADEFRSIFDGYIVQEITMPFIVDPSGLVDAGNDENNLKARVGKYLFIYGFDNSFGTTTPIVPHFYIGLNYPGRPDLPPIPKDYIVEPPTGYEWYSLDPKVDTPDPGGSPSLKSAVATPVIKIAEVEPIPPRENRRVNPSGFKQPFSISNLDLWWWLVGFGGVIATISYFLKRRYFN